MKKLPTPEQVQRTRELHRASVQRYQEKVRDQGGRKKIRPNPKRRRRLFIRNYHSERFVRWIHSQPCAVTGRCGTEWDPIVAAHVHGKGAGGDWTANIPMLQSLHDQLHKIGQETFSRRYGVDLEGLVAKTQEAWVRYERENPA